MISLVLIDKNDKERVVLHEDMRGIVAGYSDEYWDIKSFGSKKDAVGYIEKSEILDFVCVDIAIDTTMELIRMIRKKYVEPSLLLIADVSTSPLQYLRPGVRPDSLLLRPLQKEITEKTLLEFISAGMERKEENSEVDLFVVKSKDERTYIPYRDICYFEAREKKVFACTLYEEYGFYASLEDMSSSLPEEFVRCHRSFLVNSRKIKRFKNSINIIELEEGMEVPVSRSYKSSFREYRG